MKNYTGRIDTKIFELKGLSCNDSRIYVIEYGDKNMVINFQEFVKLIKTPDIFIEIYV